MIPILYEVDETKYTHDGFGQMVDAETCVVTEVANGEFSLEMTYPKNGRLIKDIIIRRQILAKPNDLDQPHAFRIFEIDKDTSDLTWTISAMSITNDESVNIVKAIKGSNKTASDAMAMIKNNLVLPSRFEYVSDIEGPIRSFENGHMTPISAVLGDEYSMQRLYGGELKRTNTSIQLLARRGRDKVTVIRKGKNAEKVHHNISYTGKYSAILPYTTLKGLTSEEKANLNYRKKITVDLGSGLKVFLHRTQDRSVIFQCAVNLNKAYEDGVHKLAKNIPEEYCPTSTVYIPASVMVGKDIVPERKLAFLIFKDGRVFISTKGMKTKPHHVVATMEWVMSKKAVETSYKALLDHHPDKDRDTVVYGDIVKAPTFNQIKLNYIVPVDFTETDEQGVALYDTRKLINSVAKNYFKEYPETYQPTINTEVDILELSDDFDNEVLRKLETVSLFDTLDVYVPELQVDVEVMVDSYKYDSLREKNISITAVSGNIPNDARNDTPQIAYLKDVDKLKDEIQKQITANDVKLYSGISRQMNQVYNTDEPPAPEDSLEGDVWFKKNDLGELSQYVFNGEEWVLSLPADYGESVKRLVAETDEASRNFWTEKEAEQNAEIDKAFKDIGIARDLAENAKQIGEELQNEVQTAKTSAQNAIDELVNTKRLLDSKANTSDVNEVKTSLNNTNDRISGVVESVNRVGNKLTLTESEISGLKDKISLTVTKSELDSVKSRVSTAESRLTVAEDGIFETVGGTKVNRIDKVNSDFTTYKSSRSMTDEQIRQDISTSTNGVIKQFNTTKETVDAFSRVIGTRSESGMLDAVARTVMSSSLFSTEISRIESDADIKARMAGGLSRPDPDLQLDPIKIIVYDNANTNSINITRVSSSDLKNPNGLPTVIKVTHSGIGTNPYLGGIKSIHAGLSYQQFVVKIIASIPEGFKINFHNNSLGTNGKYRWIGSQLGTGKFETYLAYVELGKSPSPTNAFGYFSISRDGTRGFDPSPTQKLEWYLQTYDIIDITKSNSEAINSRVDQLANSWAVKTLNSNGDVIGQMNLTDGNIKLQGKLITLDGTSNIANAVIKDAHIQDLGVNKITGMDAAFLKARIGKLSVNDITGITSSFLTATIGDAFIEQMRGKVITANNNNAIINLNDGKITFGTDSSGIYRRGTSLYTEQGMFFQQHGVSVKGVNRGVSRIIIGGDRSSESDPAKNWATGEFNGIIVETIKGIVASDHSLSDKTTIISDTIAFQAKYGGVMNDTSGWVMETYPANDGGTVSIRPIYVDNRKSDISAGDFKLLNSDNGISLRTLLGRLFINVQELANRTGGRKNIYWDLTAAWNNKRG